MIDRVGIKEAAKIHLRNNNNRSAMIGVEVLCRCISWACKSIVGFAGIIAAASLLFGFLSGAEMTAILRNTITGIVELIQMYAWRSGTSIMGLVFTILSQCLVLVLALVAISQVISAVLGTVTYVIASPIHIGVQRYYIYLAEYNHRAKVTSILSCFDHYLHILTVTLIRWLRAVLIPIGVWSAGMLVRWLLSLIVGYRAQTAVYILMTLFMVAGTAVVAFYFWARTWAVSWILAENPNVTAGEAIKKSNEMAEGHIMDLILFFLSFLGWKLLNIVTLGIVGLVFEQPYYKMASALLYKELSGSLALRPVYSDVDRFAELENRIRILEQRLGVIPQRQRLASAPGIICIKGMYAGQRFQLRPDETVIVGRDNKVSQIAFIQGASKVSGRHCAITYISKDNKYRVIDYSSNGTYINGSRLPVNTAVLVQPGTDLVLADGSNVIRLC